LTKRRILSLTVEIMTQPRYDPTMTSSQTELVETALHQLAKMDPCTWDEIPESQKTYFIQYMDKDVWTGEVDLFTLRDAALLLIRDAIARTGAFAAESAPRKVRYGGQAAT
jgi:hypothetical protein